MILHSTLHPSNHFPSHCLISNNNFNETGRANSISRISRAYGDLETQGPGARLVTHSLFRLKHIHKIRSLNYIGMVNVNPVF